MEAAFFDLDKTVIAKASLAAYGPVLRRAGYLSVAMAIRAGWGQLLFQFFGADEERMAKARSTALRLAAGWNQATLKSLVNDHLIEVVEPIVYTEALDLIELHHRAGRYIVIVSASPIEIVEPLGRYLRAHESIATLPEVDGSGNYTGEVSFYAQGPGKRDAIQELAMQRGLDLERSWAYSDSATDIPMLEIVGHAIAVNPDRELRRAAEDRGWEIRDFNHPVALSERVRVPGALLATTAMTAALFAGMVSALRRVRRRRR